MFFGLGSGNLIIDELTVFKADALDSDIKYAVNTTAENGKAYAYRDGHGNYYELDFGLRW